MDVIGEGGKGRQAQAGHESVKGWTVKATVYPVVPLPVQEWEVIKVNKRGRRQLRVMGIDLSRITNKKVEKRRFGSNETYRVRHLVTLAAVLPPPLPPAQPELGTGCSYGKLLLLYFLTVKDCPWV